MENFKNAVDHLPNKMLNSDVPLISDKPVLNSSYSSSTLALSQNLPTHVVNPLNRNTEPAKNNILDPKLNSQTISSADQHQSDQISLVNFHQHFHSQPGSSSSAGGDHRTHNYLPIVRNQITNNAPISTTVPEFLYQLTKMLTDNNKEVIEWANGKIDVHNPYKLASDVLHKYFRHSKYASFQRQLNYFGFRKLAGKGKMSPCSYINDAATMDIRSLLTIKRKTTGSTGTTDKNAMNKKRKVDDKLSPQAAYSLQRSNANKGLERSMGIGSSSSSNPLLTTLSGSGIGMIQQPSTTVAKVAIGKGVKHFLNGFQKTKARSDNFTNFANTTTTTTNNYTKDPISNFVHNSPTPNPIQNISPPNTSENKPTYAPTQYNINEERPKVKKFAEECINKINLSVLEKNYQSSLTTTTPNNDLQNKVSSPVLVSCGNSSDILNSAESNHQNVEACNSSFSNSQCATLNRDSSLVDLAYIPTLNTKAEIGPDDIKQEFTFVDFPNYFENIESDHLK